MPDRMYTKDEVIANRYVVQHLLGAGNFSYVYKVLDTLSSNVVALKIFKEGTGVLGRLRQEFQILLGLGHVNIARVYDVGQLADGTYFLKLEYIEGDDLAKLIADRRISLGKARQIASELLGAVKYLHDHHVMHRDIKPNNILTGSRGTIIVDFNISKHVQSHASSHVGTPRYMPPEVNVAGWNWTGDLYAVGVVLYEMVTAHYPFDDDYPFLSAEPRDPLEYNQLLSESLVEVLLKSISPKPEDRYQSAEEMIQALHAADWEPARQPYRPPLLDLAGVKLSDAEASKPNFNPYLSHLLTLYSQSRRNNMGTRGLDAFARATYVPTRLDTVLKPAVLSGTHSLVIVTGNAGDGKTAFIQKLEEEVERASDTTYFERLPSNNGTRFFHKGIQYLTNYDGSQDEGHTANDKVLEDFFGPFAGPRPLASPSRVHLIAINEGRLVDFLQSHQGDYPYLHKQVRDFFERERLPDSEILIVNLNLRAVVADGDDHSSIFDRLVDRLTSPSLWERCEECGIADRCYAKFNADSLNDPNHGPQIRRRLKALFEITYFRQRLHITIRDLRSALVYILFGTDDCDGIHTLLEAPDQRLEYVSRFYYAAPFDYLLPARASGDRLVRLLAQVDPGRVANPKLDAQLGFASPEELQILPPFDSRSDYDVELLGDRFRAIRPTEPESGLGPPNENGALQSRLYHAFLRRKVYFERVDDRWPQMLPYSRFIEFSNLMRTRDQVELDRVRTELIHAISLSEGIYHPDIGKNHLCLRNSQEPRVTLKSFRRFDHRRFLCKLRELDNLGSYIEYVPSVLILDYKQVESILMEVSLDLFEMLDRIRHGYTPSLNELQGSYINLLIFKRQLASTYYDEVLLTEDESEFFRVFQTPDQKLILEDASQTEVS